MKMVAKITGQGHPLVLIPGGIAGWLSLDNKQDCLAKTRKVIRIQLLNVQNALQNRPVDPDYSVQSEIEALAATLDELGIEEPLDIVAWSYGSVVALNYAACHSTRIKSLTVI
jgi:pimeloyl-ACP methyl ester carboxylesterase